MFTSILTTTLLGAALSFQTATGMVALEPANDVMVLQAPNPALVQDIASSLKASDVQRLFGEFFLIQSTPKTRSQVQAAQNEDASLKSLAVYRRPGQVSHLIADGQLLIRFKPGVSLARQTIVLQQAGVVDFKLRRDDGRSYQGQVAPESAIPVAQQLLLQSDVEYAHPDHLTHASNETQGLWEAGQAALGIMWGSRGATILDDEGSTEQVTSNTVLSAAPSVKPGGIPGATLWWDGFTISANISDDEAEATFAALASAMTSEMVAANNDDAVWLLDGFKPGAAAAGVSATAQGGAAPYPMLPQIGLLHNALGAELSDFLKGEESAEQALADVEAAYITSAKEAGFLQ